MKRNTHQTHKTAIAVHVYYLDLWSEIAAYLQAIDYSYDLFITTTESQSEAVSALVKQDFPQANIRTFPNEGMDILPFLKLIPELVEAGYVAVCKLHTKKGHDALAGVWRKLLLDTLVGDSTTIATVMQAFAGDAQLTMVGSGVLYLSVQKLMYEQNKDNIQELAAVLSIGDLPQDWGFFAGTMFWVRPALLQTLAAKTGHYFAGITHTHKADGGVEHALERLLGLLPVSSQQKLALLLPKAGMIGLRKVQTLQKKTDARSVNQTYTKGVLQQYQRLAADRSRLIQSGLFDHAAYLQQYPELTGCAADLPLHYLLVGRFQQATPHPDFDPQFYSQRYGKEFQEGEDAFLHYLREGAKAGYLLRPSKEQEMEEIPSFRYQVLNTALIDWAAQKRKVRNDDIVSIIIPVFNQGQLTQECIESLYQHTPAERFELIAVDNGSDTETQNILQQLAAKYSNIRIVRNEENLNFALGCNLGFSASQGSKIIFMNNDTTVTANWLEPLLDSLKQLNIFAAQPKLLYPDGNIQCMGIVFSDKSTLGYPIYHGMRPHECRSELPRTFKAITGACMAMKAMFFIKTYGFNPDYINGQEDIDLCIRLHHYTKKYAAYTPESQVFHHESKSHGRTKYIDRNREVFVKKWVNRIKPDALNHYNQDGFVVEKWRSDEQNKSLSIQIYEPQLKYKPILQYTNQTESNDEPDIIPSDKLLHNFINKIDKQAFVNSNPNLKERLLKNGQEDIKNYFLNIGHLEMAEGIIKFHEKFEAFHEKEYIDKYKDVRDSIKNKSFSSGFEHFLNTGYEQIISGKKKWENHSTCKHKIKKDTEKDIKAGKLKFHPIFPEYNELSYLRKNPRIKKLIELGVFNSGFDHFLEFGYEEIISGKRSYCHD